MRMLSLVIPGLVLAGCPDLTLVSGVGGSASSSSAATSSSVTSSGSSSASSSSSGTSSVFLLGSKQVAAMGEYFDDHAAGSAHAARFEAAATGPVGKLWVYVFEGSPASSIEMGIYNAGTDNGPDQLMGSGVISLPVGGSWNEVAVTATSGGPGLQVTAGKQYWIAGLAPVGSLDAYFGYNDSAGVWEHSGPMNLASLPSPWVPPVLDNNQNNGVDTVVQFYATE